MGDGVLIEFGSAVNAVQCAIKLQNRMTAANSDLPENRRIVLRIGVNLGDVMVEGGDLYGDGVNIVARLEGIAEPNAILVSGSAYDQVKNKIDAGFESLGTRYLKNIAEPVRVYRVRSSDQAARPPQVVPDKPSIAVLPFRNMSDDPEQGYLADGITEDLTTELARVSGLFVVSRNAAFTYKGKAVPPPQIARELGVRYILEGSTRRAGEEMRINAQLIDAQSGGHLWAERFDSQWAEVFTLQDKVVENVASALKLRLVGSHRPGGTSNPAAYEAYLKGLNL
jgi:adenylate cyclase